MCYYNPPCKYQGWDGECTLHHPYHVPTDAHCTIDCMDAEEVDTLTLDLIEHIDEED